MGDSTEQRSDDDVDPNLLRQLGSNDVFDREEAIERLLILSIEQLTTLSRHSVKPVRIGAARALVGKRDLAAVPPLMVLAGDNELDVREALAADVARATEWECPDELLVKLAQDEIDDVAMPVLPRVGARPHLHGTLIQLVENRETDWDVRAECVKVIGQLDDTHAALANLLPLIGATENEYLAQECARHAQRRLGELEEGASPPLPATDALTKSARAFRSWSDCPLPELGKLFESHIPILPDLAALGEFGRDLTADAERGAIPRAFHVGATVDAIERVLEGSENRSVVLAGPTGVGKTAIVHELVHRLAGRERDPVRVLRVAPNDLLVGTKYLGEWQTRVKELVQLVAAPQRVVLYVPGLAELPEVGLTSSREQGSAAALMSPDIESGRIVIVGETTTDAWSRRAGEHSSFQRLFARVDVPALPRAQTREVLELAAIDAEADVTSDALDVVLDVADMYLSDIELPGRAVGLLRRMIAEDQESRYERSDVLRTLQDATGVPPDFLDDSIAVTSEGLGAFFDRRVMGQPRAVEQVVDLCTLVKAGLDDPSKPSGILMFVGPTGVGKTELSKALAELLFGNPERLQRFDMSEYASFESYGRLIGTKSEPGTLTEAVRRQPFSVVLLDEIEKAHLNVFDLCLQIFDAGRLTDGAGRTVSFRKSIVIMTSNLGAAVRTEAGIGFDGETPPPPTEEEISRALRQFFRPEFLGRVDQIVCFDALSRETADKIARREVAKVLGRGGIARRGVSVDVDSSVYGLLLRKGYSPALGARPLKRAVESMLLLPIARLLAAREATFGACIQLTAESGQIRARILESEDETEPTVEHEPLPEADDLVRRALDLQPRAAELDGQRTDILERTHAAGYWDDTERAGLDMDELRQVEDVLERLSRFETDLDLTRANPNARTRARHIEREGRELALLERLFAASDLGDAFLRITAVRAAQASLDGVERLARMYTAWARRHDMDVELLDDRTADAGDEQEDTITLAVRGTGAHALLQSESGMHKLRRDAGDGDVESELVRVDVYRRSNESSPKSDVDVDVRTLKGKSGRLVTTLRSDVHLVHRPSMTSLRAWTAAPAEDAVQRLMPLLLACALDGAPGQHDVVRRYGFGRNASVRDPRTGRTTGRVDRVLGGELHLVSDL